MVVLGGVVVGVEVGVIAVYVASVDVVAVFSFKLLLLL